jgi:hypothetical protein
LASSCITYGQTVSFTRAQVTDLLREHAPELVLSNWIGPSQIKITRRKRQFYEIELKMLLTKALQRDSIKDKGELELRFARPWAPVTVPDDPMKLKILELPGAGVTPNFIVRFELGDGRSVVALVHLQAAPRDDSWGNPRHS